MTASVLVRRFARDRARRAAWVRLPRWRIAASGHLRAMVLLVVVAFACGGSARGDVAGAIVLRPLAALAGAWGLTTLRRDQVRAWRGLLAFTAACLALVLVQLVPLPAALFGLLPGRDLVVAISAAAGQASLARPMTLAPVETWNTLWSLVVPLAALVLAIQLGREDQRKLLALLLLIGAGSALLALAQINGDPAGPLYPYEAARSGGAIGLFANKNHQAVFLATLIPLLCAGRKIRLRRAEGAQAVRAIHALFVACALALVPLLLIADSRAGLIAGVIGALASGWAFRSLRRAQPLGQRLAGLAMAGGAIGLFALAQVADRALAWRRFFDLNPADDLRYRILPTVHQLVAAAWPWGYGVGAWQKIYLMAEPDALLSGLIMNQVHNDWLDLLVSSGVFGLALAGWALGAFGWLGAQVLLCREARSTIELGRAGVIGAALLALGSLTDYPLRTPALEVELVIFAVWLIGAVHDLRAHGRALEPGAA